MGIRIKVLVSIGVVSLSLTVIFYFLFINVILNNFDTIEERFVYDNISRIKAIIEDQSKSLDTIAHDWASWDDTYDFIQGTRKKINMPKSRLDLGQIRPIRLSKTAGLAVLIRGFCD
jgi:sensor domain CHASE-containing protein